MLQKNISKDHLGQRDLRGLREERLERIKLMNASSSSLAADDETIQHTSSLVNQKDPAIARLIPVGLNDIELVGPDAEGNDILTSLDLIKLAESAGCKVTHHHMSQMFPASEIGVTRYLDNRELVKGSPLIGRDNVPLDDRLSFLQEMRRVAKQMGEEWCNIAKGILDTYGDDEADEFKKFTIQRTKYFGRHLQAPVTKQPPMDEGLKKKFVIMLERVVSFLASHMHKVPIENIINDNPAPLGTAVGLPINLGGQEYVKGRTLVTAVAPNVKRFSSGVDWLDALHKMNQPWFPIPEMATSSKTHYRQGAKAHKFGPLWASDSGSFRVVGQQRNMYSFQRVMYPGPYVIMEAGRHLVGAWKYALKQIPGGYHGTVNFQQTLQAFREIGGMPMVSDYSNYDMSIPNWVLARIFDILAEKTKYTWEAAMLAHWIRHTGVFFPSYLSPTPGEVTYFQYSMPLLSGVHWTSVAGSTINWTAQLTTLQELGRKDLVEAWFQKKFVIAVQSDDMATMIPGKAIDLDKYKEVMAGLGLRCELKRGQQFLRKQLPIGALYRKTKGRQIRSFIRTMNSVLGGEHDTAHQPDGVLVLAMLSRMEELKPVAAISNRARELMLEFCSYFPMFKEYGIKIFDGINVINRTHGEQIEAYLKTRQGITWYSALLSRADSDPQAMHLAQQLAAQVGDIAGLSIHEQRSLTTVCYKNLFRDPTPNELDEYKRIMDLNFNM